MTAPRQQDAPPLDKYGSRILRKHESVYCSNCGWLHVPGKIFTSSNCPDCGVFDVLYVGDTDELHLSEEQPDGWMQPCGEKMLFRDCRDVEIVSVRLTPWGIEDRARSLLFTRIIEDPLEYQIPDEVGHAWADRAVRLWRNYTGRLVHKEPFPGSDQAVSARCTCRRTLVHDPGCVVLADDFEMPEPRIKPDSWLTPWDVPGQELPFHLIDRMYTRPGPVEDSRELRIEGDGELQPDGYCLSILEVGEEPLGPGAVYEPEAETVLAAWQIYDAAHTWTLPDGRKVRFRDCQSVCITDDPPLELSIEFNRVGGPPGLGYQLKRDIQPDVASRMVQQWRAYKMPKKIVQRSPTTQWISFTNITHVFSKLDGIHLLVDYSGKGKHTLEIQGDQTVSYPLDNDERYQVAERVQEAWEEFSAKLVQGPLPDIAKPLGCTCRWFARHLPDCPAVQPKITSEAPRSPQPNGTTNDLLTDLSHRMMEQNVYLDDLLTILKPKEQPDPRTVPLPGFNSIADREPSLTERHAFLAGVVRFAMYLTHFSTAKQQEEFFDMLGVPTVKCQKCQNRVPLERAMLHPKIPTAYLGTDCCADKVLVEIREKELKSA